MPKLIFAHQAETEEEERAIHKLSRSRHAPMDVILRARMIVSSWEGHRTTLIAKQLDCHPQTVRKRVHRFNEDGIEGLMDRPRSGRNRRITEGERSRIIALVSTTPPGRLIRDSGGELRADDEEAAAHWTLNALTETAQKQGIEVKRSQVRRILLTEGVHWRSVRSWMTSADPEFAKKERSL